MLLYPICTLNVSCGSLTYPNTSLHTWFDFSVINRHYNRYFCAFKSCNAKGKIQLKFRVMSHVTLNLSDLKVVAFLRSFLKMLSHLSLLGTHRYQSQTLNLPPREEAVWNKSYFKSPTWRSWQKKLRRLEQRGVHRCPYALRTTLHACSPRSSCQLWEAGLNTC